MKPIDTFSYELGAADCFCEMVRAGVKRLALAHPCDSPPGAGPVPALFRGAVPEVRRQALRGGRGLFNGLVPPVSEPGEVQRFVLPGGQRPPGVPGPEGGEESRPGPGHLWPGAPGHRLAVWQAALLHRRGHPAAAGEQHRERVKHPLGGSQGAFFVKGLVPVGGTAGFLAGWCSPKSGGAALQGLELREGTFPPGGRHGAGGLPAACCFFG